MNLREVLNGLADDIIREGTQDNTPLADILYRMPPASKRTLIIGGAMRIARQEEFTERQEFLNRRRNSMLDV